MSSVIKDLRKTLFQHYRQWWGKKVFLLVGRGASQLYFTLVKLFLKMHHSVFVLTEAIFNNKVIEHREIKTITVFQKTWTKDTVTKVWRSLKVTRLETKTSDLRLKLKGGFMFFLSWIVRVSASAIAVPPLPLSHLNINGCYSSRNTASILYLLHLKGRYVNLSKSKLCFFLVYSLH